MDMTWPFDRLEGTYTPKRSPATRIRVAVTLQEHIRYYLYLNGVFDGATIYPYPRQFTMYLTPGIVNVIEVYAVDEAGNRSDPATMTIDMTAQ
jgi:hypothetical protein